MDSCHPLPRKGPVSKEEVLGSLMFSREPPSPSVKGVLLYKPLIICFLPDPWVLGCSALQVCWSLLHSLASFLKAGGVFEVELVE